MSVSDVLADLWKVNASENFSARETVVRGAGSANPSESLNGVDPMKKIYILLGLLILCAPVAPAYGQVSSELSMPPNGNNQRAEVSQWVGLVKITVAYHSPNIHGRGGRDRTGHIWGELIPYGFFDEGLGPSRSTPWRAGANESTTITFSHNVKVEGKDLPA